MSLKEYGIEDAVPGIKTSANNKDHGILDSTKLWRQAELQKLLNTKLINSYRPPIWERYEFASFAVYVIMVLIFSAFLGLRNPQIGGMTGAIVLPLICYLFSGNEGLELILISLIGMAIGLSSGFLFPILISGMRGKGHNSGPSYMGGFGGGRGGGLPGGIILSDDERKNLKK